MSPEPQQLQRRSSSLPDLRGRSEGRKLFIIALRCGRLENCLFLFVEQAPSVGVVLRQRAPAPSARDDDLGNLLRFRILFPEATS